MNLQELKNRGYADYKELKAVGIKRTIDLGRNSLDLQSKIVELNDGSQWSYIPEDEIYELRDTPFSVNIY